MAVETGVWAESGVAAISMAATKVRGRDEVLQNLIGNLLAIAYDRTKAIIPLEPKDGLTPISCHAIGEMGHPALVARKNKLL
jgi:hypothetical protein